MRVYATQYLEHIATVTLTIDLNGDLYTVTRNYHREDYPQNDRTDTHTFRMVDGVPRWTTNNHIPPADSIKELRIDHTPGYRMLNTERAREREMDEFAARYRKAQAGRRMSAEQLSEIRANTDPETTHVIDVLSGRVTRL